MLRSPHLLHGLPGCWVLFLLLQVLSINAQSWQWVEHVGGFGGEVFEGLAVDAGGRVWFAGSYEESFALNSQSLPVYGGADLFIAGADENGVVRWTTTAGGPFDDMVAGLTIDPAGAILCTGTFWQEAVFDEERIQTTANLKGIFIAKYEPSGALGWVRVVEGTMLKEVTDIAADREGNIFLTGFFQEQLMVDTTVLTAKGASDLFLMKFDKDGQLQWATSAGYSGDTRALRMALIGDEIILSGFFNDTTLIAGSRFTANTFDRDVFVTRFDRFGRATWARKAGGVHDEEVTGLAIGSNGDIYLTGWLVGVMKLSESLQIESKTGQSDFFLLRYSARGEPLMGRAMGGDRLQQASDLVAFDGGVALSGHYQGEMTIDGVTISAGVGFGSFIAHYDQSGNLNWIKNLPAGEGAFITHLAATPDGALLAGGAFRGDISFDDFSFSAGAQFDLFLGKLTVQTTSVEPSPSRGALHLFPNPTSREIFLESPSLEFTATLFDHSGRRVLHTRNEKRLSVGQLPSGIYTLQFADDHGIQYHKVVIRQ
jgi:hypothetical protein